MCEERGELAGGVGSAIQAILRAVTGVGITIWDHPRTAFDHTDQKS